MGKNKGKGGKAFRSGKGHSEGKRDLILKEDDLESYARVKKSLGNLRLEVTLTDGSTAIGVIRGLLVRKQIIAVGHTVLVSRREYQEGVVDILHLYKDEEVKELVKIGAIQQEFRTTDENTEREENMAGKGYIFVSAKSGRNMTDDDEKIIKELSGCQVRQYDPLADLPKNREDDDEDKDANLDDL